MPSGWSLGASGPSESCTLIRTRCQAPTRPCPPGPADGDCAWAVASDSTAATATDIRAFMRAPSGLNVHRSSLRKPSATALFAGQQYRLHHGHSAIHREGLAHHVAGRRTTKPEYRGGNLLRLAGAADGNALRNIGIGAFIPAHNVSSNLRVD